MNPRKTGQGATIDRMQSKMPGILPGGQAEAEERATPRESGVVDAGLRRASLPPHSKTLSRCLCDPSSKTHEAGPSSSAIHARHLTL
jgi:hypothetical protein